VAVVSYLYRRGARYHYRRRLYLRQLVNHPITVPLGTADPVEARRLVARLSVRWDATMMMVRDQVTRGYMTATEAVAVFRRGLDDELGLATAARFDGDGNGDERTARVFEAMYRVAAKLDPDAESVPANLLEAHTDGFSDVDRRAVALMLKVLAPHRTAGRDADQTLASIDAPVTPATLRDARVQLLLGRAEAQARAALADHPNVASAGDPIGRLLDDNVVRETRTAPSAPSASVAGTTATAASVQSADSPFLTRDTRRFSEVIEATIASIQRSGDWNQDMAQRRRAIQAFAWGSGDKQLCDYEPHDAELFATTLQRLPKDFRWGTFEQGNMSRPFAEIMAEVGESAGTQRSVRTLNRDLTTLSRFGRELMKTAWKPRYGKDAVLDFACFMGRTPADNPSDPDRMPYTDEQLVTLFSSPIYTGGGGCARRLKIELNGTVYQDAAYWVPLLLVYGVLSREEACGVECQDFVFDVETPFVAIVENMTKSIDGETPAGLKRPSRHRMVPLHPELLRLGLREYVGRMEADGHRMAFPELYEEHIKRGGKRFYASAGRYIIAYVDDIIPLQRTSCGKRADLHSLRTTGGSALEHSNAKQLIVNDLMGHAREGTGPRKYSRAWFAKGGGKVLARRFEVLVKALPNVTGHLQPTPLTLLPVRERSRTGSAKGNVSRQKA